MTFCTAHRPDRYTVRLPSEIALSEPRRRAPLQPRQQKPAQIFTDWASI